MGIAGFLLHIVQLQAAAKGLPIDIYLQTNISSEAYGWYQHCGFKLTKTNEIDQLPAKLLEYLVQSHNEVIQCRYIHFVTPQLWEYDILHSGGDPDSEFYQR